MQQLTAYDVEFHLLSDGPKTPRSARGASLSPGREPNRSRNPGKSDDEDGNDDDDDDDDNLDLPLLAKEATAAAITRLRDELEEARRLLAEKSKQLTLYQEQLSHAKTALQSLTHENNELKDALAAEKAHRETAESTQA
jgi:hypothetical protein